MIWNPAFLSCNGEENVLHLLLKFNETQRQREQFLCTRRLNIHEEITWCLVIDCNKIMEKNI
jgi:hypothetical protein